MNCPICCGKATRLYPLQNITVIYNCPSCDLDFLSPQPTVSEVSTSTDAGYFANFGNPATEKMKVNTFQKAIKGLSLPKRGKALEVGCAAGFITAYLNRIGWEATGIDTEPQIVKIAQKAQGHKILLGDFIKHPFDTKFDLIVMFDLLEHIADPILALKRAKKLLNPQGKIIILTPNIDSLNHRLLKRLWSAYYPEHIFLYSPRSLSIVAKKAGLRTIFCHPFHKVVNWTYFWHALCHRYPYKVFNFLGEIHLNLQWSINDDSMLSVLQ